MINIKETLYKQNNFTSVEFDCFFPAVHLSVGGKLTTHDVLHQNLQTIWTESAIPVTYTVKV